MPFPAPAANAVAPVGTGVRRAAACTSCGVAQYRARISGAVPRPRRAARPEVALDGEAACFDHPGKRAVAACHQCGRFVCLLCSVEFGGQVWCPSCVAAGRGQGKPSILEPSRMLYDSIALAVPLVSLMRSGRSPSHRARHVGVFGDEVETPAQPGAPQPLAIRSGHADRAGADRRLALARRLLVGSLSDGAIWFPVAKGIAACRAAAASRGRAPACGWAPTTSSW